MTSQPSNGRSDDRRQFTLAGWHSFLLAGAVYFALLASVGPLFSATGREPKWWPTVATTLTAWGVLWFLYYRWRLRQALIVHFFGPMVVWGLALTASVIRLFWWLFSTGAPPITGFLLAIGAMVVLGCGLSTLISFPYAVMILVRQGIWKPRRSVGWRKRRQADRQ
ncbi:MAG: hypothetical protein ABFD16_03755 [Thermoguttaceae bacterium]|jgi:hypothetical protein